MAVAPSNIASGTCGTCTWGIMHDGTLVVSQGTLGLAAFSTWPWLAYASDITRVDMTPSISAGLTCDEMFKDCVNLVEADLSGLDVSSSSSAMMMFYGCSSLERLDVSMWNVGRMVAVAGMFLECGTNDLVLDLSSWDTSGIANSSALFTTYGDPDATAYLGNRSFTGGRIVTGAGWTLEAALPPQNYGTGDTYTWHDTTGWRTAISECYRCDSSGNAKPDGGEYVKAGATWSIGTTGSAITQTSSGKHDYIRDDVMSGLSMTGTVEILDPSTSSIFTGTLVASGTPAIIAASPNELEVTISLTDGSVTAEHYATVPSGTPPVLSAHKSDGMVDGLGLGASYKEGYVNNGFPQAILGQPVPPTFYYTTKPSAPLDLPVKPCIVIQTSDWSVWYCDGETAPAYHKLSDQNNLKKTDNYLAEVRLTNVDFYSWVTTVANVHTTGTADQLTQARFYADNYANYNLPCVDSHISVYSIDSSGVVYLRCVALDIRTNNVYVNCRSDGTWTGWVQLLPTSGGTMTGNIFFSSENRTIFRIPRAKSGGTGWAWTPFAMQNNDGTDIGHIGAYGGALTPTYMYLGYGDYNSSTQLRIYPSGRIEIPSSYLTCHVVLYNNASGSNGTITLSASAANYNHMRIFYRTNDGTRYVESTDVYSPNGKTAQLTVPWDSGNTMYLKNRGVNISGTSIATNGSSYSECWFDSSHGRGHANTIYITRVEAWNE